jgi:multidrug efflux pump subunit AcrB
MGAIVRWCLGNKSVVFLATFLLVGSGAYATTQLNQELLPDVSFPIVTISTPVPGAGPDVVDEQVSQEIEGVVGGVEEVESVESTSSAGFSVVLVEFDLDTDTEEAEADLQTALDDVQLPESAEEPEIQTQSASQFPILTLSLATDDSNLTDLTEYAEDDVVPAIEEIEGVASVDLIGGAEDRIEVELRPQEISERGLSTDAIVGAVSGAEVDAPVGSVPVDGLETPIRATSNLDGPAALEALPVGVEGGAAGAGAAAAPTGATAGAPTAGAAPTADPAASAGAPTGTAPAGAVPPAGATAGAAPEPVLLGEVAEVREAGSDLSGVSRTNGEPSLGLNVVKETDANTIEVVEEIEGVLDDAREEIGEDQVVIVANSAEDVEESVSGLVEEALVGALLAIFVIFMFLRSLRATLVTAVSLPTSVLAALLFSWGYDLTLNIVTLAGLTIAVGRVVDDAIVVLENSYRYVQGGLDPEEAALKGTTEVASAITSSTLTTTAVFVPLALVGGIVSKFFVPLSLTVALALLASLIVSVTIIPVLVSIFLKRRGVPEREDLELPEEFSRRRNRRREAGGLARNLLRVLAGVAVLAAASAAAFVAAARAGVLGGLGLPAGLVDAAAGLDPTSPVVIGAAVAAFVVVVTLVVLARSGTSGEEEDGMLVRLYTPMLVWALRHRDRGAWERRLGGSLLVVLLLAVAGGVLLGLSAAGTIGGLPAGLGSRNATTIVSAVAAAAVVGYLVLWLRTDHRRLVLALAFVAFVGGLATIPLLAVSFFPTSEEQLLIADVELEAGIAIGRTSERLRPFEDFLGKNDAIESYQVSIGGEDAFDPESPVRPGNRAQAFITVADGENVANTLERIDREGDRLYGENFQVQIISNGPPQGGLEAVLTGGTQEDLRRASVLVERRLDDLDDVNNVQSDLSGGNREIEVDVDPEDAAAAGLSPGAVSGTLGSLLGGRTVTSLGDTPVVVGVPDDAVDSLDEVRELPVGGGSVVSEVADVGEVEAPAAISRVEGDRAVTVSARITSSDTQSVSTAAQEAIAEVDLPAGVEARVGGESEDIDESFRNLFLSIIVAMVLVFLILVVFFGSLLVPFVILLSVPLTTVGVFGALYLTDTALSLPSLLGILLLIGIVVSNAILLMDFAIKARDDYATPEEALVAAGRARLRPILMTAFATIFALMPLALGLSGGNSGLISSSLGITVIGGLTTSTFLTLLVVPVAYSLLAGDRVRKRRRG